jgi:hypothetical protein
MKSTPYVFSAKLHARVVVVDRLASSWCACCVFQLDRTAPVVTPALRGNWDELHVSVTDTGDGVPERVVERLFQPFTQGDATYSRQHGGTGLGLAICKQMVELLGGRIWLDNQIVSSEGEQSQSSTPLSPSSSVHSRAVGGPHGASFHFVILCRRNSSAARRPSIPLSATLSSPSRFSFSSFSSFLASLSAASAAASASAPSLPSASSAFSTPPLSPRLLASPPYPPTPSTPLSPRSLASLCSPLFSAFSSQQLPSTPSPPSSHSASSFSPIPTIGSSSFSSGDTPTVSNSRNNSTDCMQAHHCADAAAASHRSSDVSVVASSTDPPACRPTSEDDKHLQDELSTQILGTLALCRLSRLDPLAHSRVNTVVEDNKTNQKLLLQMLRRLGHTADVANDGIEAVDAWRKKKYDIIVR